MNKKVEKRLAMIKVMVEQIKLMCDFIPDDCDDVMECEDLYIIEAQFERIERLASEGVDYTRNTYDAFEFEED